MKLSVLFCISFFSCFISNASANLEDVLRDFEFVQLSEVSHKISKRSTDNSDLRKIEFSALKKKFKLYLHQDSDVLASGFVIKTVDDQNREKTINLNDLSTLYHGYLADDVESSVSAMVDDSGLLTAQIRATDDIYTIEPAEPYLPGVANSTMIIYRQSDLKNNSGSQFCGFVRETEAESEARTSSVPNSYYEALTRDRAKRQVSSPSRNTCPLMLVADYKFYEHVAQRSMSRAVSYLISLFDWINNMYRQVQFGYGISGVGFQIKEIRIHQSPTVVAYPDRHYNEAVEEWETQNLLEVFSRDSYFSQFCLAHLFTHQSFTGGVLGLAYIASPREYSVGGMCSPQFYKAGQKLYLNTGWSSSLNAQKRRLLTQEAYLVTSHELGHNWGSEHDPDTAECSPSAEVGGKYVMYTYSVSGFDANNKVFSPCSRRAMSNVLLVKSSTCFAEKSDQFCGNGRVEAPAEDCDSGQGVKDGTDPCCNTNCKFRPTAKCSDANSVCCSGCQFSPTSVKCQTADTDSCDGPSFCTGKSAQCQKASPKPDNTECLGRSGKCRAGTCVPLCETLGVGWKSCVCDKVDRSCQLCCMSNDSVCAPVLINNLQRFLADGTPCLQGFCNQGKCNKVVANTVQRYWDIVESLHPNRLGQFMKANIVGTVIILSLVVWIPASIIVWRVDRKRDKEAELKAQQAREDYDQRSLTRSQNIRIRPSVIIPRSPNRHRLDAVHMRQPPPHSSISAYGPTSHHWNR